MTTNRTSREIPVYQGHDIISGGNSSANDFDYIINGGNATSTYTVILSGNFVDISEWSNRNQIVSNIYYLKDIDGNYIKDINGNFILVLGNSYIQNTIWTDRNQI